MNRKIIKLETSRSTDLRALRTRDSLRDAMLALLKKKPLEEISVRDITSTARTGYATFYRHYATKEALLDDLARREVQELVKLALPVLDSADLLSAYTTHFGCVNRNRSAWRTLLNGGAAATIKEELLKVSLEVAAERSRPRDWPAMELRVILVVTCTVELMTWWLNQRSRMTVAEVAKILDRMVLTPLMDRSRDAQKNRG